jgi:hypothetical protein
MLSQCLCEHKRRRPELSEGEVNSGWGFEM